VENGRKQEEETEVKDYTQKKSHALLLFNKAKQKAKKGSTLLIFLLFLKIAFSSIALVRESEADDGIYRVEWKKYYVYTQEKEL